MNKVKNIPTQVKNNGILIGFVGIKRNCPDEHSKLIKSLAQQQNRSNYLILRGNFTKTQLWDQAFPYIEELKIESLGLHSFQSKRLKNFSIPWYSNLKAIDISYSKILSVESLAYMEAQKLECLNLESNFITEMKSLVKAHWPNIQIIQLRQSKSMQFPTGRIRTDSQNFKLKIASGPMKEDLSIHVKVQATNFNFQRGDGTKISQNLMMFIVKNRMERKQYFDQLNQTNVKKESKKLNL